MHRQMLASEVQKAATQVGTIALYVTGGIGSEAWWPASQGEVPLIRRRALAFLSEVAARGVPVPPLELEREVDMEDAICCGLPVTCGMSRLATVLCRQAGLASE